MAVVTGMVDTAAGYLHRAADPVLTDADASKLVEDAERLGNTAYSLLQHMQGSDAEHIPHQIVRPFLRWVRGLQIGNTIFFRADHVPNYELLTIDLRSFISSINDPSQTLTDARDEIDWPFLRVTVPSQALGMLPHFAIIGHELGHAIQDDIKPDLTPHAGIIQDSINRMKARLTTAGGTWGLAQELDRQRIVGSWLNEIKADAVGHYVGGPAFYFALGAFLELIGPGWGVGTSHPPSELRRRFILDELTAGAPSFINVFGNATGMIVGEETNSPHIRRLPNPDDLFSYLSKDMPAHSAAICVELIPVIEALAPDIYSAAKSTIEGKNPDLIYTVGRLEADLENHLEALCYLVPPIEYHDHGVRRPTSLAGILNVGAAAMLTKLDDFPAPSGIAVNDVALQMERLHELLLKGVELSEALTLWSEH